MSFPSLRLLWSRRLALVLLLLPVSGRGFVSSPASFDPANLRPARPPVEAAEAGLRLVSSGSRAVEFELVIGSPELTPGPDGVIVRAPGLDGLARPGEPDLPAREVLIGLPQSGGVVLSAEGLEPLTLSGVVVGPVTSFDGRVPPRRAADAAGLWPGEPAELVEIVTVRGVRTARVRLNPLRYDAGRQELAGFRRLRVTARFEQAPRPTGRTDRFDPVLERVLLNGAEARDWRVATEEPEPGELFFDRALDWCKVRTETTGVYRVRGAELAAAGYDLAAIDPRTLKLYSVGDWRMNGPYPDTMVEVPIAVRTAAADRFGPDDFLVFYAESPSTWRTDTAGNRTWQMNYFTRYRPWWLSWGGVEGRRFADLPAGGAINPRPSVSSIARLEVDRLCPARSGLLWLWERYVKVAGRDTALFHRPLDLPGCDSIEEVGGRLYGVRSGTDRTPTYFTRVHLNGFLLDSVVVRPDVRTPPPVDFRLPAPPAAAVRPGQDTLTFELYGEPQTTIYLDWLEVRYRARLELSGERSFIEFGFDSAGTHEFGIEGGSGEVFLLEVTDPFRPRRLTGTSVTDRRRDARLVTTGPVRLAAALAGELREPVSVERRAPGGLRRNPQNADYYVVSPDEFYPAARLFARHRDGNIAGLENARAAAARLSDIYDDYGFGVEEPGAIKAFFIARQPVYGLFAGDGTYDYRNCLGAEYPPMVPAYQVGFDVDPEVYGQVAKAYDAWYADFDGDGGSPDMILGRITARSAVELRQQLDKVRAYEEQLPGLWARRFLLLADDEYEGSPERPDPIRFRHITGCEELYVLTRDRLDPVKVYLTEYPLTGINDKAGARAELYDRLEQGALFWAFYGHGAGFQLTHERVLHIDGVGRVGGETRNSIAFFGSCGVGRFDDTRYESVAEELVRLPEGGCIATVAATKATISGPNERFAREMFIGMLDNPEEPVGPAFYQAWLNYTIYNLFGDPAVRPRLPEPELTFELAPDTLFPGDTVGVTGSVPAASGTYGIIARELNLFRQYRSELGAVNYILPGRQVHQAHGTFQDSRLATAFRVPTLDFPDTTTVPNGAYIRLPGTGAVSLIAWDGRTGYSAGRRNLPLGPAREQQDFTPPQLTVYADGVRLSRTDTVSVPESFVIRGELADESGILLAPDPDFGLALIPSGRALDRVSLHDLFRYDLNSTTRGSFEYDYSPAQARDSVAFFASDNFRNRLIATYHVRAGLNLPLRIDSTLVWPNPVEDEALFTFELTREAFVGLTIYTISGRPIRRIPPTLFGFGYNQLRWDGRDAHGNAPANGIYLYRLDARSTDTGAGSTAAGARDRFIILR